LLATSLSAGHVAYVIPSADGTNAPNYLMSEIPSESTITTLRSLARHYMDISELCILALHVEVRMHCFHHLLAIAHGQHTDYHGIIDKMEPDENVTRLNKDLTAIDDVMQQTLQHRKFRSAVSVLFVVLVICIFVPLYDVGSGSVVVIVRSVTFVRCALQN